MSVETRSVTRSVAHTVDPVQLRQHNLLILQDFYAWISGSTQAAAWSRPYLQLNIHGLLDACSAMPPFGDGMRKMLFHLILIRFPP